MTKLFVLVYDKLCSGISFNGYPHDLVEEKFKSPFVKATINKVIDYLKEKLDLSEKQLFLKGEECFYLYLNQKLRRLGYKAFGSADEKARAAPKSSSSSTTTGGITTAIWRLLA